MSAETLAIVLACLNGLIAIGGIILKRNASAEAEKNAARDKLIEVLFKKHDEDARRLDDLKLQIAERHYGKDELDRRFDRIEGSMRAGFDGLLTEVRTLSAALMSHIQKEDAQR